MNIIATNFVLYRNTIYSAMQTHRLTVPTTEFIYCFNSVLLNCKHSFLGLMHYTEEDYIYDAEIISNLIARFFEISLIPSLSMSPREDYWCHLEDTLLVKWSHVLEELLPTRDARLIGMRHYSMRQVDYIGILLRAILSVKSLILNEVRTQCGL